MRAGRLVTAGAVAGLALVAAACGTRLSPTAAGPTTTYAPIVAPAIPPGSGSVEVLYASSLAGAMRTIGPEFDKTTGYGFVGNPGTSAALDADIKDGSKHGDVLVSAFTSEDTGLEGKTNGGWVSWYAAFANKAPYTYTVTVLNRAPDPSGADAFVEFLVGSQGDGILSNLGLNILLPPRVTGPTPMALISVLPSS